MGVGGVVVAVLVVVDLVGMFSLMKCLNVGVGSGVGAVVAQDGGAALSALVVAVHRQTWSCTRRDWAGMGARVTRLRAARGVWVREHTVILDFRGYFRAEVGPICVPTRLKKHFLSYY